MHRSDHGSARKALLEVPDETVGTTSEPERQSDTRGWSSLVRIAIDALKKVPALWAKVVDGVKQAYSTFQAKVWPAIKAVVGAISTLITAWDIWNYFH